MRILLIAVIWIAFSFEVSAQDLSNELYDISDAYDYAGYSGNGGGSNPLGIIIAIAATIAAYYYLLSSYAEWKQRKAINEKPYTNIDGNHWILTIIGYLIVAVCISLPLIVIINLIDHSSSANGIRYLIYFSSFLLLAYLRRNGNPDWDRWARRIVALTMLLALLIVASQFIGLNENKITSSQESRQLAPEKNPFAAIVDNDSKTPSQKPSLSPIKTEHSIQINNACREQISVSITYWNGEDWVTRGWWNVAPFSRIDTGSQTNSKEIYAYATSASYTWKGTAGSGLARPISKEIYTSSAASPMTASDTTIVSFLLVSATDSSDSSSSFYEFTLSCPSESEAHFAAIKAVHPDWEEIANSTKFNKWIKSRPQQLRLQYEGIKKNGTATEVISMLGDYKSNISNIAKPPSNTSRNHNSDIEKSTLKNCDIKAVMSDQDYRNCGLNPPRL